MSNADNLGAVLDPVILEWFARSGAPFAMETVIGTEADRKGGHIARRNGRLVLRETAQAESAESFGDHRRWRYYNTNNLWLDLEALTEPPALPLIVNRKTVDPSDPASPEVIQTETAMGAALGAFDGALALCVPRSRFVPVKTTDDLLALRSDVYALRRRRPRGARSPSRRTSRSTRATSSASRTSRRAFPPVRRRCATAGASSCAATCASAPA